MKIKNLLFCVCLCLLVNPFKGKAQACNVQDSLALIALLDSSQVIDGQGLQNYWNTALPVNTWYGVTVELGHVTGINLSNVIINGAIPPQLGNLTYLSILNLNETFLQGSIPDSLGMLGNLTVLDLGNNSNYYLLDVSANLNGNIPSSLGNLSSLETLNLANNNLSGSIPASLGNLSSLTALYLNNNHLGGSIPSQLGNLSSLTTCYLNNNKLSGSIPSQLGNLSSLTTLYLNNNQINGSIPSQLGNLANLQSLYLHINHLTGNIPGQLGNLKNLQTLYLNQNNLTGNIPSELGNLTQLTTLNLDSNKLSGNIPGSLGNLSALTGLALSYNNLTGSMPSQFGNIGNGNLNNFSDVYLILNNNKLNGFIPQFDQASSNLYFHIRLDSNNYTFDGLEQFVTQTNVGSSNFIADFINAPQPTIPLIQNGNKLTVSVGGTPANDTFYLYKNGLLQKTQAGDSVFTITKPGIYNVIATNAVLTFGNRYLDYYSNPQAPYLNVNFDTYLTLYSDTILVSSLLPLTLLSFTGTLQHHNALLNWQTSNEVNIQSFTVERSGNGTSFTPLGRIPATDAPGLNNYNYTDASPLQGSNYYRLKMYDKDGAFTYSNTVLLNNGGEAFALQVQPNPAAANATVMVTTPLAGKYSITVTGADGKIVKHINGVAVTGVNAINVDTDGMAAGVYIISYKNIDGIHSLKLIKK